MKQMLNVLQRKVVNNMVVYILIGIVVSETGFFLWWLSKVAKYAISLENQIKARAQYDAAVMKEFKKAMKGSRLNPPGVALKPKKTSILN
jgi:hypothetical protein